MRLRAARRLGKGANGQPAKKRRVRHRFTKKEIDCVCKRVSLTDTEQLLQVGIAIEADSLHLEAFPAQKKLWKCIRVSSGLSLFVAERKT